MLELTPPETKPYPGAYYKEERPAVRRAWEACDRYLQTPNAKLDRWLEAEGFEVVPERSKSRVEIYRDSRRQGVEVAAKAWRVETCRKIKSWKLTRITPQIAQELSWRLLEVKMIDLVAENRTVAETLDKRVDAAEASSDGMDFLPEWMRWVVLHPGLTFTLEEVAENAKLSSKVEAYEEAFPAPHQGSLNMLQTYRADKKMLESFYKECAKLHNEAVKRTQTQEGTGEDAETEAIADLEILFKGE